MNIESIDLNLLRLFDAIHTARSVSQAADALRLTQPAVSQGLARLRSALGDPLFVRAAGGVRATPRADRMAPAIHAALHALETAVVDSAGFDPTRAERTFRLHMTDIGEGRFLPQLIPALRKRAPHTRIEALRLGTHELALAMDQGRVDLAFGFLPGLEAMRSAVLFQDRYVILVRKRHPLVRALKSHAATPDLVRTLEFITVRTHAHTLMALETLRMGDRVRLTTEHFMALPAILEATDLAVIMPRNIALSSFAPHQEFELIDTDFPMREFDVGIHWSPRYDADPANRWLRSLVLELYRDQPQP
jgi:DNA-binding transcriptional LysR family regulator